jgi:hypothetical protein
LKKNEERRKKSKKMNNQATFPNQATFLAIAEHLDPATFLAFSERLEVPFYFTEEPRTFLVNCLFTNSFIKRSSIPPGTRIVPLNCKDYEGHSVGSFTQVAIVTVVTSQFSMGYRACILDNDADLPADVNGLLGMRDSMRMIDLAEALC